MMESRIDVIEYRAIAPQLWSDLARSVMTIQKKAATSAIAGLYAALGLKKLFRSEAFVSEAWLPLGVASKKMAVHRQSFCSCSMLYTIERFREFPGRDSICYLRC